MPTRSIKVLPDHYYHVYNRGNNRQKIFRRKWDYQYFLKKMNQYFSRASIDVIAYCLMPNHFHLLIQLIKEVDFRNVMRSFSTSYVKSFHLWHKTSGHLYEDDYQAKRIEDTGHLIQVIPYIHLNPVMGGIVEDPLEWPHSNCREWCRVHEVFPFGDLRTSLYGGPENYRSHLNEYLKRAREIKEIEQMLLGRRK